MAVKKISTTTTKTTTANTATTVTANAETETVKEEVKVAAAKPTARQYEQEELIPCHSITNGGLYIVGARSQFFYDFADYGDVVEMEYRDLVYMIRSKNVNVMAPRLIIDDPEFVAQFPELSKVYESMYKVDDLRGVLQMNVRDMIQAIDSLPDGAKESVKGIAATLIDNGTIDSIAKVRALDDYFGTQLLLTMAQV